MPPRNPAGLVRPPGDPPSGPLKAHADVHPEHADLRVVLHPPKIGVVLDPEREVPVRVETVRREAIVPDREGFREEPLRGPAPNADAGPDRHVSGVAPVPHRPAAPG